MIVINRSIHTWQWETHVNGFHWLNAICFFWLEKQIGFLLFVVFFNFGLKCYLYFCTFVKIIPGNTDLFQLNNHFRPIPILPVQIRHRKPLPYLFSSESNHPGCQSSCRWQEEVQSMQQVGPIGVDPEGNWSLPGHIQSLQLNVPSMGY